ncbi:MAG TPA: restriction endonuclease [Desulfobulbaceae bacterium]|nr:restriction endonuclease [Desulfobulbaceae bacterium]
MDFVDRLKELASRIRKQVDNIQTEEATKTAFVMPFIQTLGYDVFDPTEVIPEFTADVGSKKGEKVDYVISMDSKPTILFECKCCGSNLHEEHAAQLRRYFHVTDARIGVLTNGITYRFYSDLEQANIMDDNPFMVFNMLEIDEQLIPELKKLTKSAFSLDEMLTTASELKYVRAIKKVLGKELTSPSPDFIRFFVGKVYSGKKTQQVIDQFSDLVKNSFKQFINDRINDRLKSAMNDQENDDSQNIDEYDNEVDNNVIAQNSDKGIVTTQEEWDGFLIVRAILSEVVDVERVVDRDTKSYFGILLDDNNRKPLCRLHFNTAKKYIGIFDSKKKETKHHIERISDIYKFTDLLRKTIGYYDG